MIVLALGNSVMTRSSDHTEKLYCCHYYYYYFILDRQILLAKNTSMMIMYLLQDRTLLTLCHRSHFTYPYL
jgi:hypothetical protein